MNRSGTASPVKRILTASLLVILALLFGLTYVTSRKTEEAFRHQVKALDAQLDHQLQLNVDSYQRGLFTATATTSGRLPKVGAFLLKHHIRHFIWGIHMQTTLAELPSLSQFAEIEPALDKISVMTKTSISGAAESTLNLESLLIRTDDGNYRLDGVHGSWTIDQQQTQQFGLTADSLTVRSDQLSLVLEGLNILAESDEQVRQRDTWQWRTLRVTDAGQTLLSLDEGMLKRWVELEGETLTDRSELTLNGLTLLDQGFDRLHVKTAVSGIDRAFLQRIITFANDYRSRLLAAGEIPFDLQLQALSLYQELLQSGLTLKLKDFVLAQKDAALRARGQFRLSGTVAPGEGELQVDFDEPIFLALYRLIEGARQLPERAETTLDKEARQLLQTLTGQSVLRRDEAHYTLVYRFEQGRHLLNP